jgi:hypothetical protein
MRRRWRGRWARRSVKLLISSTHKIYSLQERLSDTIRRRMLTVLLLLVVISPDLQIIKSKDEDRDRRERADLAAQVIAAFDEDIEGAELHLVVMLA